MSELSSKIVSATKWSSMTELAAKLVAPITTMVLARILNPEAFGVLVTATMVIGFAEIFTDAGFQKYIVQQDFDSEDHLYKTTSIAFWTNLVFSLLIWIILIIFRNPLAELVGNKGFGSVIAVSSICIPLAAFSSLQMALFRRSFDFKTLFQVRIVGVCIPLFITIPLSLLTHSFWALIVGMICLNVSNAFLLTIKSKWKPQVFYSFSLLHQMLSFSIWSLIEAVTVWLTGYIDVFLVGKYLDEYYLGLYRTSINTVGQIVSLITAASTPVLFAALSRLQSDKTEFESIYLKFQRIVGLMVVPLGMGIFIFRDLITEILLGSKWQPAAYFLGLWGLTSSITIVLAHYGSEVFRALGKPKLSVLVQVSQIGCLIPVVLITLPKGFDVLCEWRALIRLELVIANLVVMWLIIGLSPIKQIRNILPSILAACIAAVFCLFIPKTQNYWMAFIQLLSAGAVYLSIIICFPKERNILFNLKYIIKIK